MNHLASAEPTPRVSVIIPAYNEERYIGGTLESVNTAIAEYAKDHTTPIEVIVVNNNSSDRTAEIACAHGATVVFEGHNNIAIARNAGARAARGEIFAFLDADDHMSPNFLTLIDEVMKSGKYVGGGARIVWDKQSAWIALFNGLGNCLRRFFGVSNALPFTSREAFDRIGGFDERYYASEDMKFAAGLRKLGRQEGKRFCVIADGYVLKSARKFERYGGGLIMAGFLMFLVSPWLMRSKRACFFWYSGKK